MKFKPGDFLKEANVSWDYHLFVDEVNEKQYHVWHCWTPFENEVALVYSKNAGHDCWMSFKKVDDRYNKIAHLPALIGQKHLQINK
jgi:hypothetical protein